MGLDLTSGQDANVTVPATRPVFLLRMEFAGGIELFSSAGPVTFDEAAYSDSFVMVALADTVRARIQIPWTPSRVTRIQNGSYRGQGAEIWYIPAAPSDDDVFDLADGILLMDGITRSIEFEGARISAEVVHVSNRESLAPNFTLDQVTSFAAAAGTQLEFDGETITLEARR